MLKVELARRALRWSQDKTAKRSGFSQPEISMLERGLLRPPPERLKRLARALGVPAETLLSEVQVVEHAAR